MDVDDGGSFLEDSEAFWPEIKWAYSYYLHASPIKISWQTSAWFKSYDKNTLA